MEEGPSIVHITEDVLPKAQNKINNLKLFF